MIVNVDEIKEKVSMEEVLGHLGYSLNRKNRCACPVHGGKNPNFSVRDDIGVCWSQCGGKAWDVIELIREVKQLTFPEAVEYLAGIGGQQIQYSQSNRAEVVEAAKKEQERKNVLAETNRKVLAVYSEGQTYEPGQRYTLDNREWSAEALQAFGVCITPKRNELVLRAQAGEMGSQELMELGLIREAQREGGGLYDFFYDRLLFSFHDTKGRIIGFTGRARPDQDQRSKYKNSMESLLFKKREFLFGLFQNRRDIGQQGALIMEGMADVVTAYDYGVRNAVATGGTALTKEQVQLLKRYTKQVTILFDGDKAGREAARMAVDECLAHGLRVSVAFFEDPSEEYQQRGITKFDPDSFLRTIGKKAFLAFLESSTQDGLIWRVMEEWDNKDFFRQQAAITLAGKLIAQGGNDMMVDFYQRELAKSEYFGRSFKGSLADVIKEEKDRMLREGNKPKLSAQQQADIIKYGIYIQNNQYFISGSTEVEGVPISNFCVRPVMLVVGSTSSQRLVEITNVYGAKFTANIESDYFVEMSQFKKEVERRGNYLFLENARIEHFVKLKRKLYEEMQTCFPITTMGWHKQQEFWAWANGIYTTDGKWLPTDEHGVVLHKEHRFFLPAFAQVNDEILADDDDNTYEDQKTFVYVDEVKAPTLAEWAQRMHEVHDVNGVFGVAWYLAAIFRDIIYDKFEFFPHLNLFGPPGTGKSFLAWSLSYMFGKARRPFNLHDGTDVGFFRRMAQQRNGLAWYDEYNNNIHPRRAQGLKNAYDGAGREKGVASTDNRTVTTKVNAGLIISGQTMPTQDIALMTRCIMLSFKDTVRDAEAKKRADALQAIQGSGCLSQITSQLQRYRKEVEERFDVCYDEVRVLLGRMLDGKEVLDRLVNNYCIPLAMYLMLYERENLPYSIEELIDRCYEAIISQNEAISQEDDLASWWKIVEYYIDKKEMGLINERDYLVQEISEMKVKTPAGVGSSTSTQSLRFNPKKTIFFLRFTNSYRFYMEQMRKEGNQAMINEAGIKHYLKSSPAFVGEIRGKKFGTHGTKSCYAFDMDALPFDLPLSILTNDDNPF